MLRLTSIPSSSIRLLKIVLLSGRSFEDLSGDNLSPGFVIGSFEDLLGDGLSLGLVVVLRNSSLSTVSSAIL